MIVVWLVWYLKYFFFSSFNILPDILSVLDNIARSRQGNPGMDPFLARVSSLYRPTIKSSSKHLTKPQWNFFPLIQAVLNKSKSRFFRIKGHQLHLWVCICVFWKYILECMSRSSSYTTYFLAALLPSTELSWTTQLYRCTESTVSVFYLFVFVYIVFMYLHVLHRYF